MTLRGSRHWLRALWLGVFVLLWAAPAAAAEPIVVWHAYRGEEEAALERALAAFSDAARERGQQVSISTLAVPFDAFNSKIGAAVPLGDGPHLFIQAHEHIDRHRRREIIAPLGQPLEPGAFRPVAVEAMTRDGEVFAVPLNLKSLALFVNTKHAAPPATFEAIAEVEATLGSDVHPLVYTAMDPFSHAPLLHAFGGAMLRDGAFAMVGPQAERSVEFAKRFVDQGIVPQDIDGAMVTDFFRSGKAAYAISGPWLVSDLEDAVPYKVVPLPPLAETGRPLAPFLTVEGAMLTPKGAKSETARALVHYLGSRAVAEDRQRTGGSPSARVDVPPSDPNIEAFAKQAETAVLETSPTLPTAFEMAGRAMRKILQGQAEAGPALREAEERFNNVVYRPLPPPASPWPLAIISALALLGALVWVRRSRDAHPGPTIRESMHAYRYLAHAVLAVGLLVILPLAVGAAISLFAGSTDMFYVGLGNFVEILTGRGGSLLSTGSFYIVLLVTLLWTVVNVAFHLGIGLVVGLLLSRPILRMKAIYRVLLIIPWAVPNYVTALAWKGMFNRQFGAVTGMIHAINDLFGTSIEPISWFAQFSTSFTANVATNVWLGFPFMMVVTIGALTSVPRDVLEAAEVDGASRWQRLTKVTLPIIRPTLMPAVTLGAIWTFNMFNVVFLVSGGQPDGTTDILVSEAYRWAFTREAQYGYAAAYAVLIFLLLFFGTKILDRWKARWSGSGREETPE